VPDDADRSHPLARASALRAEQGGSLLVQVGGARFAVRVVGWRAQGRDPLVTLRPALRPVVLRSAPSSGPAVGGSDAGAVAFVRADLAMASSLFGACGISLGDAAQADVRVVDPPPPHLVAFGEPSGLSASGGELRVAVDGRPVRARLAPGASPQAAAREFAAALTRAGLQAVVSTNARATSSAAPSVDVSVRRADGALATVSALPDEPITTDATLSVRIGAVSLARGVRHFGDDDAATGTLEERTIVKAYADADPTTIDVFYIANFAGSGRIGESFIASESGPGGLSSRSR
jgi:hypothetical protein